jgi:uncharacterized protein involved in exopolysaccharide biosynthesis/Mrp family chromosome partitioning ATPase
MNNRQPGPPPPQKTGLTLHDVYYVLFRHKWKIAILSLIGIAASLALCQWWPFPYMSEAEILISYVQEPTKSPGDIGGESRMKTPDDRGSDILNTELKVMTSRDLALDVAKALGPERILGKSAKAPNVSDASGVISENLTAEVAKQCDIITLRFKASDPTLVQPVLSNLMVAYKKKYVETHLAAGIPDTFLEKWTDDSRALLTETIDALRDEKSRLGITSLEDAKKNEADLIARTTEGIFQARAELAEVNSTVSDLQQRLAPVKSDAAAPLTNRPMSMPPEPPPDVVSRYQSLTATLGSRRATEQSLLAQFTTNSPMVQNARRQRLNAETDVKQLEDQYPGLVAVKHADSERQGSGPAHVQTTMDPATALRETLSRQHALAARIQELTLQLVQARSEATNVDAAEDRITQKQTEKEVAEAKYKHFLLTSQQALIDEQVGSGRVSGISIAETPTPPSRDSKQVLKTAGGVLGFFLALAFGLPFLIEMYLDQSLKRPADVEARLAVHHFVSIPRMNGNGRPRSIPSAKDRLLLNHASGDSPKSDPKDKQLAPLHGGSGEIAAWDQRHELRPFFETLRDRLMTYFDVINLTHKPKLVAVTSCGPGAGVTTTAAGLASSLSEIGEGNVLLVNMNAPDGEAHLFYKGKMACGIEEALKKEKRGGALIGGNLYVAREADVEDHLPRVLPKRFSHLVPMMKASDYDYIIFDMPPVSQISITPRLARFMDMVLLVVESGKTDGELARRAADMLKETKTNVGVVLNKNREYLPRRLQQEI